MEEDGMIYGIDRRQFCELLMSKLDMSWEKNTSPFWSVSCSKQGTLWVEYDGKGHIQLRVFQEYPINAVRIV